MIKLYPISLGNHDNIYIIGKMKDLITFKIMGITTINHAYVVTYTISNSNKSIIDYLDKNKIFTELRDGLSNKFDLTLVNNSDNFLIKRNGDEQKIFCANIYENVNKYLIASSNYKQKVVSVDEENYMVMINNNTNLKNNRK